MILIFFLQRRMGGGTTSFTAHLAEGFRRLNEEVRILRINEKRELTEPFGEYGHDITSVSGKEALKLARNNPSVLTAPTNADRLPAGFTPKLLNAGTMPILHDMTQRHLYPERWQRFICIRQSLEHIGKDARYIGHPYNRVLKNTEVLTKRHGVISTARVDTCKRTAMILKANNLLPKTKYIKVLGAEFRLYSYGLAKRYKSFKQSGKTLNWPLTFAAPVELCRHAQYNVDLTRLPSDGGGTQYAQMEAMDAGCVNIMHSDWFIDPETDELRAGDMVRDVHALTVSSPEELADIVQSRNSSKRDASMRQAGYRLLAKHDAKKIAKQYLEVLNS